jgi:hypothetical protein
MRKYFPFLTSLFIVLLLGYNCNNIFAHAGGHYQQNAVFNTWVLFNGQSIKGNFLLAKNEEIVLEQANGQIITIPIVQLSKQDQKLARYKIKQSTQLNQGITQTETTNTTTQNFTPFIVLVGLFFACFILYQFTQTTKQWYNKKNIAMLLCISIALISFINNSTPLFSIPKTRTSFIDSAFNPYKPAIQTSYDENYFHVASTGIPSHNMMVGITSWQQQVPLPQNYSGNNQWSIPLKPQYASTPLSTKNNFMRGAVALAVNGVPIFNALNNRGDDAFLIGELDQWGGHCGKGDDYHYHIAPLHLSASSGLQPIAFALDGFAVFGTKEPNGTTMKPLDDCHGHIGTNGIYHYHGTNTYPYVIGAMKGVVQTDESKPAPENQIIPQAFAKPIRPPLKPLRGAVITQFKSTGNNAYQLTYTLENKEGYVNYSWDANNNYNFIFTDIQGNKTNATYQRRKDREVKRPN